MGSDDKQPVGGPHAGLSATLEKRLCALEQELGKQRAVISAAKSLLLENPLISGYAQKHCQPLVQLLKEF